MTISNSEKCVGIDLGTTFSVISHLGKDGSPKTLLNEEGELTTASAVFFDRETYVVGREAIKAGEFEPERLAVHAKRDMGHNKFRNLIEGEEIPPQVILAMVLKKLKNDATLLIGDFEKAVITVPAYFNEPRRKATQEAGIMAGIEVLDIINEPTAAAIAYGVEKGFVNSQGKTTCPETILVYDLGGGTFDVTLMRIEKDQYNTIATAGDVHLGGIDWDQRLVDCIAEQFVKEHEVDPRECPVGLERLQKEASEVKRALSARPSITVQISHNGFVSKLKISREQFEELTADLLERTRLTVHRVLRDAEVTWTDVTRLLLVGGSTRMPMVQSMLEQESSLEVDRSLSPDEAISHGAAIYAGILTHRNKDGDSNVTVENVNSHDLGVLGVHPKTKEKQRKIMIARNTTLPAQRVSKFQTFKQGQKNVSVKIVEGGTNTGQGATQIGTCRVTDLPPDLPSGTVVQVTFEYSHDGRLNVSADLPTIEKQATITIQRTSGFSAEEVESWKSRIEKGFPTPDRESSDNEVDSNIETSSEIETSSGNKASADIQAGSEIDTMPTAETETQAQADEPSQTTTQEPDPQENPMDPPSPKTESPTPDPGDFGGLFDNLESPKSEPASTDDDQLDDFLKNFG